MNKTEAKTYLAIAFPGMPVQQAFLELVKLFNQQLNTFVGAICAEKNFKEWTETVGGEKYTLPMISYPKNNAAEVAIRSIACCIRYPQSSVAYAQSRKLDSDDVDETGEPITIMIVIGIIVALAPIVLPFIMGLVDSFFKADEAKKRIEADVAKSVASDAKKAEEKTKTIVLIAGAVAIVVVVVIVGRRIL